MNSTRNSVVLLSAIFIVLSCSRTKDTIISRNYHALTTKYNILFNGQQAFLQGMDEIHNDYQDDWFEVLPIEPIAFGKEPIDLPEFGNQKNNDETLTSFELAEEKAVKAIQMHGMNLGGLERNRQIDDAYLLLGKARYYQQRFIPAIEAFNYVIAEYPNADLIAETKIWRAKANIRIENEKLAIESMKLLLVIRDTLEAELPDNIKEQAHTAMAMAYLKADSLQKAKKHLHLATRTLKNRAQGARNLFVLGQMYNREDKKDSASLVFQKLANFKKSPYKYKIRANIELAKNVANDSASQFILERLQKLVTIRENRPYLDELYYQMAVLYENKDSVNLARTYYNKSLQANSEANKQKTYTYEKLGNDAFKHSKYLDASAYYDSVMQVSQDTLSLRIRRVKRKYNNLASLIAFEKSIQTSDSILSIATMTPEAQKQFFETFIKKRKQAEEEAAQRRLNQLAASSSNGGIISGTTKGGWYFYNSQSLNFGVAEFKRVWGNRELQDNWRWSSTSEPGISIQIEDPSEEVVEQKEDVGTYLAAIPKDKEALDSLQILRTTALYQSGILYKERFQDYELAAQRLTRALKENNDPDLVLPLHWHLYQLYEQVQNPSASKKHQQVILDEFPNTPFARVIKNQDEPISSENEEEEDEIAIAYKELYYKYKGAKYEELIKEINLFIGKIPNSELLPKFELLKALAIGKSFPKEDYQKALEYVAVNYGNTIEGERAKEILTKLAAQ